MPCGAIAGPRTTRPRRDEEVEVIDGTVRLAGQLTVPADARGIVVFAHGSGSSRHSPRNRYVAAVLNQAGLGTLLFDLLTPDEEARPGQRVRHRAAGRAAWSASRSWLRAQPEAAGVQVGYFGASTGAAAALWAAAEPDARIAAVVSRGGRPDLAGPRLRWSGRRRCSSSAAATTVVLGLNRQAQAQLRCENDLVVVPGATHLFEEPGTLTAAAELARDWFTRHLAPGRPSVT